LGGRITVKTVEGYKPITINKGTQQGDKFKLPNMVKKKTLFKGKLIIIRDYLILNLVEVEEEII